MRLDQMFEKYPENLIGFRVNKGVKIIDYWLNPKWNILDEYISEGIEIKKQKVSEDNGFNYYVMYSQTESLEGLYNILVKIIEYNINLEKKQELFNQKINELKDIFGKLDYDELTSLSFDTPLLLGTPDVSVSKNGDIESDDQEIEVIETEPDTENVVNEAEGVDEAEEVVEESNVA